MINIAKRIKELREQFKLTQEYLANVLGASNRAISRWENGITYPDITLLPIIATQFNVTVDYLLDVDKEKMKKKLMTY